MARADISIPGLDFDIVKVNTFSLNTHFYGKSDKIFGFVSWWAKTKSALIHLLWESNVEYIITVYNVSN